ncbi:MAG: DUF1552 domain-containing protein [Pirellulaceae bacterium]
MTKSRLLESGNTRVSRRLRLASKGARCPGNCDSGYSCVYSSTMSWRSATQPLPKQINPKAVFERLFGGSGDASQQARNARRRSVLDFVLEDSRDLSRQLGATTSAKLGERYFSSVRDLETRIERASQLARSRLGLRRSGSSRKRTRALRMADLMFLAFQADITRVCTYVLANEGSNRSYRFIDVPDGHHDLSHHGNDGARRLRKISDSRPAARVLAREAAWSARGDGTLLDHCMIAYGSGNSDGNRHNHDDLPILVAGGGCRDDPRWPTSRRAGSNASE